MRQRPISTLVPYTLLFLTLRLRSIRVLLFFFFFNDTATTEIYTLSLHDALPIFGARGSPRRRLAARWSRICRCHLGLALDRKSTRLNSSHLVISYAVFCLKKKKRFKNSAKGWSSVQPQLQLHSLSQIL